MCKLERKRKNDHYLQIELHRWKIQESTEKLSYKVNKLKSVACIQENNNYDKIYQ